MKASLAPALGTTAPLGLGCRRPCAASRQVAPRRPSSGIPLQLRRRAATLSIQAVQQEATPGAPAQPVPPQPPAQADSRLRGVLQLGVVGTVASLLAAGGGILIDQFSTVPCALSPGGCEAIPLYMKVPLVATHLFSFVLIPATMHVFYTRAAALKEAGAQDPFAAMLGLAFVMVAIAGEIGWHVTQDWFYVEDYSILNFVFYFFLMLGTSLWALGIKEDNPNTTADEWLDLLLLATPVLAGAAYLAAATWTHTKVPIYILLAIQYAVLTKRFWNLLDTPKVLLFPLFSVGVNLTFIALLNAHKTDPVLNPLFHILHDAAGTELGVAIIATLVFLRLPPDAQGPRLLK